MIIKKVNLFSLFVILTVSFIKCAVSNTENNMKQPMFDRSSCIVTPKTKSIYSALLMSFYSLPRVQKYFIEELLEYRFADKKFKATQDPVLKQPEITLSAYLGKKMVELRNIKKQFPICDDGILDPFIPLSTTNGAFSWTDLHKSLSQNVASLFKFTFKVFISRDENSSDNIRVMAMERTIVVVRLEGTYFSLADMINNGFRSELFNMSWSQKLSLDYVPSIRACFVSHPEVLVFNIMRFFPKSPDFKEDSFYNGIFVIEKNLMIDCHKYMLASRIEYDETEKTYSSVALDLNDGLEYRYNHDGTVTNTNPVGDMIRDRSSVYLFYIKISEGQDSSSTVVVNEKEELESIVQGQSVSKENVESEPVILSTVIKKRKFEESSPTEIVTESFIANWDLIYRPNHDDIALQKSQVKHFEKVEKYLKDKLANNLSTEFLNFQAKLFYRTYPLGSENYSFKAGPYAVLEIFLASLASNPNIVTSLFDSFEDDTQTETQQMFTLAIVKMLLGCKDISLKKIIDFFQSNQSFNLEKPVNRESVDLYFTAKFFHILRIFNRNDLISSPKMNLIKYSGLENDDPELILTNQFSTVIRPYLMRQPRSANIKGLWYDYSYGTEPIRRRCVFKSDSEMFFIEIDRRSLASKCAFDSSEVVMNGSEYACVGVAAVVHTGKGEVLEYHAIDTLQPTQMFRSIVPGRRIIVSEANDKNINYFSDLIKTKSVLLFYVKNIPRDLERKFTSSLGNKLCTAAILDYSRDLNLKND